ncbi:MAG: UDP-N-acetylmuramoyl-L-alanine--D-glutamate ligase [Anaerolineaceae bacterium]|nr:UDP-N-acetylmuramoyl-L-alanine--D-glutamate ligase [Anaerolineaceae bacterium]
MMRKNWEGKAVLILGAARQGLALAEFLATRGAIVTLNDNRAQEKLPTEIASLKHLSINWVLGSHPLEILDKQTLICVSGGVPLDLPILKEARKRGISISNDSQIFLESIPAKTIGITGSAGKTTTTTLLGCMAKHAKAEKTWIGGNIGNPLILQAEAIAADDLVILELSSFQLELITKSPQIAAVLNITPNHLDRHGTLACYSSAKQRILDYQSAQDIAVLNREDVGSWALKDIVKGNVISFGVAKPKTNDWTGTYIDQGMIYYHTPKEDVPIIATQEIHLRGEHNLMNVSSAIAIAMAADIPLESIQSGITGFSGVAHRLEFVREWKGASWYNDSIATAPERTMAAINAFDEPLVLLLGGRDKKLPWDILAREIHQRVDHVITFGEASNLIIDAIGKTNPQERPYSVDQCQDLFEAVQIAAKRSENGDVVLLSPGGTSYDAYKDFEERGEWFRKWVKELS